MHRYFKIFFILNILFYTTTLFAQTGKISGRVIDNATGEPLPMANVLITDSNIGAATDMNGYYAILNVRPGKYSVRASTIGYQSVIVQEVKVSIDLTTNIDFELNPESVDIGGEVVVIAEKPLVTKDLTSSTAFVGSEDIEALPVTDFQEILELQAGVVGGNVRGGRTGEVLYTIDGVPVTDVYDGSTVIDVNTSAIQELQFISGAFNAEYGRALSGVVNLATKEGNNDFKANMNTYIGDYLSSRTGIFRDVDSFEPFAIKNFEAGISGPVIPDHVYFFINGRYLSNDGYLDGLRVYNPWDITFNKNPGAPLDERYEIQQTGDSSIVPMNWNERIFMQGKLTYTVFPGFKISYNFLFDSEDYQTYEHDFAYNPEGRYKKFSRGITNIFNITHAPSASTFYQLNVSNFYKFYTQYAYESLDDPRWTHTELENQQPQEMPSFKTGGTRHGIYKRMTNSYDFKFDFTSQIFRSHQIKFGMDALFSTVNSNSYGFIQWKDKNGNGVFDPGEDTVQDPEYTGDPYVNIRLPNLSDPAENLSINLHTAKPYEISAYIQDKIEFDDMIINIGVRFDYFEPDGKMLTDPTDPDIYRPRKTENVEKTIEERRQYWYKSATSKYQFSPRLGVAFPITDRGVVHFSYGHFFQVPNYQWLYENPEYKFEYGTGNVGVAGNPDLKPEQTISGEIGLQQALTDNITIDVTGYFRDIRDLTGTRADEIIIFGASSRYSQYVNSDFGFVKGVIFSLTKRFSDGWSATVDYTLQSAKGNASDPAASRNRLISNELPEIQLVSLNWDQTHTLNATFTYASEDNWGVSFIGRYGSGMPYTPSQSINISKLLYNSETKPAYYNVDLRGYYDLQIYDNIKASFFCKIYNLFDVRNEMQVYNDSGTADFTLTEYLRRISGKPAIINSLDEYYRNPTFYSEPRRIELGFSLYIN